MFMNYKFLHVLVILLAESLAEKCIPFFEHQYANDTAFTSGRIRRLNLMTNEILMFDQMKPNASELCTIDYENNLEGQVIKVGVDQLYPYITYSEKDATVSGLFGEAWMILEKALKFKSAYKEFNDFTVLASGEVDLMLVPTPIMAPTTYFTFSTVIYENSYSLFMMSDGIAISKWWYLHIFDEYIWFLLIIFVIFLTMIMICVDGVEKSWCKQPCNPDGFSYPAYSLLCVLGATTGQGFQEMPRTWSLRFCALSALHMGMLMSCGFNSTLTSYLAQRSHQIKINSFADVWNYGTHSLCARDGSYAWKQIHRDINESDHTEAFKIKQRQLINRNCPNMENEEEVKKRLCRTGFIYVETYHRFLKNYLQVQNECQMVKISGYYWSSKAVFMHHAGSKYRKIINTYLLRLHSSGILHYLEDKWIYGREFQKTYNDFHPVELGHVQILITGFLIMMFVSVIICIFENIWFYFFDNKICRIF